MNGTRRDISTGWSVFLGVLLMILGFITLGAQVFTGFATVLFFGWMLIIGGVVQFLHGFFSRYDRTRSFVGGILTFLVGGFIVLNPTFTAATVTLLVSILLLVIGTYYVISSLIVRNRNWGWTLTGGILTLALGVVILTGWPVSGLAAIGLFVGLAFFITGFSMVIGAFEASEVPEAEYRRITLAGAKGGTAKKEKNKKKEGITEEDKEMKEREEKKH